MAAVDNAPGHLNELSDDDDFNGGAIPGESEEATPANAAGEDGLDEDEDDLFGDGGDDAEEPA